MGQFLVIPPPAQTEGLRNMASNGTALSNAATATAQRGTFNAAGKFTVSSNLDTTNVAGYAVSGLVPQGPALPGFGKTNSGAATGFPAAASHPFRMERGSIFEKRGKPWIF